MGSACKAISLFWYEDGESLKIRGGVVIPVLPPPGARGVTSTAIMKAAHQWLGPRAIKGTWSPVLIITDSSRPPNQTLLTLILLQNFYFYQTEDKPPPEVCSRCISFYLIVRDVEEAKHTSTSYYTYEYSLFI